MEHFGVDREGNTRKDIDKIAYNQSINAKRNLHVECNTKLLETYHYDWIEGNLEKRLSELVLSVGLETKPMPPEEILEVLKNKGIIEKSANKYLEAMNAIRVEALDRDTIHLRLKNNKIANAEKYTRLLSDLHKSYKGELEAQKRIDFDDMIIRATEAIISGKFKPTWRHILVDEFQDISMARMDFITALTIYGPSPQRTVVGDDWQSIYRFSGGKLELTTRIGDVIGPHSITKLEKTFRYGSSIADVAGKFVMKNPEQYRKDVKTLRQDEEPQVLMFDSEVNGENNLEKRVTQLVKNIKRKDPASSVAILARYNYLLKGTRKELSQAKINKNIRYWTFHKSKGLEADYCILIGFIQGPYGFPNLNKEEAVRDALLPALDDFPHSEERRLLYVAITRARKKSFIIADPRAPSEFVTELLDSEYNLRIISEVFQEKSRKKYKCPLCSDGYFKLHIGPYGKYYRCTSNDRSPKNPVCKSNPRECEKCGAPSIDTNDRTICSDEACRNEKLICDRCGRPMKIKNGPYGKFLGCSGYGDPRDQCTEKRSLL